MTMTMVEVMAMMMVEVASRERKWGKFVRHMNQINPAMLALPTTHV